ncbi:hypothetical protein LSTR_LSTR008103 [Laodelphax striatellus]|uniref:rRNA biogenesis protein RRP36 n=1 Tax=Laodelphax striatellus TaxID=195883 RepID=A0A482XDI1_LAOST|nr:hypothetical protein LSTR_LSTR008103 [Laodelphax striatellus]
MFLVNEENCKSKEESMEMDLRKNVNISKMFENILEGMKGMETNMKEEMKGMGTNMKEEMKGMKEEMKVGNDKLETNMKLEMTEMKVGIEEFRNKNGENNKRRDEEVRSDLNEIKSDVEKCEEDQKIMKSEVDNLKMNVEEKIQLGRIEIDEILKDSRRKNKIVARDPRFEDACGVYDGKKFKTNYKFLDKIVS